jgi:hypothetical protein
MRLPIVAAVFAALAISACSSDDGDPTPPPQAELTSAQTKFTAADLASYSFTWRQGCFCGDDRGRPTRITVVDDAITRAVYVDDQTPSKNPDIKTIDGLYALIQRGYDQHYDTVTVTYDPELGYPLTVFFDPVKNASDEETQLWLEDFITPGDAASAATAR